MNFLNGKLLFEFFLAVYLVKVSLTAKQCMFSSIEHPCHDAKSCTNIKQCDEDTYICINFYHYKNNTPELFFADCFNQNCLKEPGDDKCILRYYDAGTISCCCHGDLCNKNVTFSPNNIKPPPTSALTVTSVRTDAPSSSTSYLIVFILTPTVFFAVIVIVIAYFYKRFLKTKSKMRLVQDHALNTPPIQSKPVQMHEQVSRGQFGCVWKGVYEHKLVAVKVILPKERTSWETEKTIYVDYAIKHENVLSFYSAEKRCESNGLQYWIVTEFHENGSLADYLPNVVFDVNGLIKILVSIVAGLTYIHQEDNSATPVKPAISHRDFKSRNILVKQDGTCCVSDFGSACSFADGYETDEAKAQVGTNRYMAPEVLQGAVAFQAESFLCIDIYAMALVLWECLSRCNESAAPVEAYRAPYELEVGLRPTLEDMKECVVDRQYRPILKPEWRQHERLSVICDSIEECWDDDSDARLSACCVYERLKQLANKTDGEESEENNWSTQDTDDNDNNCTISDERSYLLSAHESSLDENFEKPPEYSNISIDSYYVDE